MIAICGGLMRTGSVNMYQIMREIVEARDVGYAPEMPLNHEEEYFLENYSDWAKGEDIVVLKFHLWREEFNDIKDRIKAVVTIRDIRDVVVSLMNFRGSEFEPVLNSVAVSRNISGQKEWEEFVPEDRLLLVKYEYFIYNRIMTTHQVAEFIGAPITMELAHEIEMKWNLVANINRAKEGHGELDRNYMAKRHIHSGKVGQWKNRLSYEQIIKIQEKTGEDWFRENGYQLHV